MTTILHIESSSSAAENSFSRQIGALTVAGLKEADPSARVIERDLVKSNIPHLSPEFIVAAFSGSEDHAILSLSKTLLDELFKSDILVIEAPMYNFGIPSVLKAWIDHVVRAGKTFAYGGNGPQGLLKGKKAILILSRGGIYTEGDYKVMDFQESYLRAVFAFIGITDVESIYIEGVAMGEEQRSKAIDAARARAHSITAKAA